MRNSLKGLVLTNEPHRDKAGPCSPEQGGVGGPSDFVLLSLVNKETALDLLIGQNLGR